jgi:hypothetical protein
MWFKLYEVLTVIYNTWDFGILDSIHYVRCEVFTAVTMKNTVFSDVMPCGPSKNRRF